MELESERRRQEALNKTFEEEANIDFLRWFDLGEGEIFSAHFEWFRYLDHQIPVDPLIETFAQDLEVLHVNADPEYYRTMQRDCFYNILCCGLCGSDDNPVKQGHFNDLANARHLILRENSLVYRIERGAARSYIFLYSAVRRFTHDLELVFSLDDPINVERCEESGVKFPCLSVQYKNVPVAKVYATPENIDLFIEKFNKQREIARERLRSRGIDQNQRNVHEVLMDFRKELLTTDLPEHGHKPVRAKLRKDEAAKLYQGLANKLARHGVLVEGYLFSNVVQGPAPPVAQIVRDEEPTAQTVPQSTRNHVLDYSVNDVREVLTSLELGHICASFEKASVDGAFLLVISDEALKELGVASSIERTKILAWVLKNK